MILVLGVVLTVFAGTRVDRQSGETINNFLNQYTLMQVATDTCFFAVMAVGMTIVIISGGIDLSIGSIYAISGVSMALILRGMGECSPAATISVGIASCLGIGLACGLLNGVMVVGLKVHPFIITLGTMWVFRGIAFVTSRAVSILVPGSLIGVTKANLGMQTSVYPVPLLVMLTVTGLGALFLGRTVAGRNTYAIGGNRDAARYSGVRTNAMLVLVYTIAGLTAGIAAFVGSTYYGSASCADATGYELYVIAAAVVGGASLSGGKGSAFSATLGALLIILIRQSIRTLRLDQNYEWIIIGCAIIVAVVLDQLNARLTARRLSRSAGE